MDLLDLLNPDFEPSDEELEAIMQRVAVAAREEAERAQAVLFAALAEDLTLTKLLEGTDDNDRVTPASKS
jgi:hypothetical protein